jgi:predicted small metal-binding protein
MGVSIRCRDIGAEYDHVIQGGSVAELLSDAARHAVRSHDCSEAMVASAEWLEQMRGVIRNASRPAHLRASSPPIRPPYEAGP